MNRVTFPAPDAIVYPESDGQPLAENTQQLRWIVVLYGNLAAQFREDPNVFVASDLFWYPVEGQPEIRLAPDVMLMFGRPKGDRRSYQQWREENVPATVVMEVLSPSNDYFEMADKFAFYEEHGVEEYYVYDPDKNHLLIYERRGEALRRIRTVAGYVSPRLGIRFEMTDPEMTVFGPDGNRFLSFEDLKASQEAEKRRADEERQLRLLAEGRAQQAEGRAQQAEQRAARIAALSRKVRRQQSTPEELAELERVENEAAE